MLLAMLGYARLNLFQGLNLNMKDLHKQLVFTVWLLLYNVCLLQHYGDEHFSFNTFWKHCRNNGCLGIVRELEAQGTIP